MLKQGYKQVEIAKAIAKDRSVVCRPIKRYSDRRNGVYNDELALKKYAKPQKGKPELIRFTASVQQNVESLLRKDYSPEQVIGTLKKDFVKSPFISI